MRSLFLRIFLWFGGGVVVLIAYLDLVLLMTNPAALVTLWQPLGRGAMVTAARTAVEKYERQGAPALETYLDDLSRDTHVAPCLVSGSGKALSPECNDIAMPGLDELSAGEADRFTYVKGSQLGFVRAVGSTGASYFLVLSLPPRPTVLLHPHGSAGWIRRAPFFLLAFAVCYLLAQYLSRPVTQLRRLTNRFAEGDLSIRITDRGLLKRQDELGGLARDFNQMAARIETLVAAQQRLLADVSHELRSPLTRLALALGLLKRKSEDEGHPSIQRMEREVRQLNTLIQRLLTLSRLESIDEPLEAEPIALCTLLEEVVTDADFEAAQNEKRVELARRDGCTVRGERELLRSAVENVVRNAIRYTPRGTRVTVEVMREDTRHEAVIRVRDQGPGVPAEEIPRLFEPFYRVATARERDSGGAGLGLAITHRIVGLHGGRVSAANRERGGLELSIALPLVHAAPQLEAPLVAALGCGEVHVAQNK